MILRYYVNTKRQSTGDYEVHTESCPWLPGVDSRLYLGMFYDCHAAVQKAARHVKPVNGCYHCCNPCHTQ
jgi:hypothetical protein